MKTNIKLKQNLIYYEFLFLKCKILKVYIIFIINEHFFLVFGFFHFAIVISLDNVNHPIIK